MDTKKIIDKYKKEKNLEVKAKVHGGGEVVGMEVDENNFLYYVVRNGNEFEIKEAQHTKIYDFELKVKPRIVVHEN